MKVRFWGVRGSIPSPGASTMRYGGDTTCIEMKVGTETIIFDAGSGIRPLGLKLMGEAQGEAIKIHLFIPILTGIIFKGSRFLCPPLFQTIIS